MRTTVNFAAATGCIGAVIGLCVFAGCHSDEFDDPDDAWQLEQPDDNAPDNLQHENPGLQPDPSVDPVDVLWTIDNTASACRMQRTLWEGLDAFIEQLADTGSDFQLGVTTTQMSEDALFDPVAQPGHLQSTPQPVPGFSDECLFSVYGPDDPEVESGEADIGDVDYADPTPFEAALQRAVDCTEDPHQFERLFNFDADRLRCRANLPVCDETQHRPDDPHCLCPGHSEHDFSECIDCEGSVELEEMFPPPEAYRDIPRVLRASDYIDDDTGELEVGRLRDDFRCMSFVGTRGHGFGRGLAAAATALSPEMTGGTDPNAEPDQFPNAGLLRADAESAVIFASASNDCSDDGTLDEFSFCGRHICTIEEQLGDQSALRPVETLADELVGNLTDARGLGEMAEVRENLRVASIHPAHLSLEQIEDEMGRPIPDSCPEDPGDDMPGPHTWVEPPSCSSEHGIGWSPRRYVAFLDEFDQSFPHGAAATDGIVCGEMADNFTDLAGFVATGW